MMLEEMKGKLQRVLSPKRFKHSIGVMDTAVDLAARYGESTEKAAVAGLLHDCAREIRGEEIFKLCEKHGVAVDEIARLQPELLHGPLGSVLVTEEYGVNDSAIMKAIRFHTTGCSVMDLLSKIIFMADYIEPGRGFPGVADVRREAFFNIDRAMVMALDKTINHIIVKGVLIHPDTINARNDIVLRHMKKTKGY